MSYYFEDSWRHGPDLPFPMQEGLMVSFRNAVIFVSGSIDYKPGVDLSDENPDDGYLYKLISTGPEAKWQKMPKNSCSELKYFNNPV